MVEDREGSPWRAIPSRSLLEGVRLALGRSDPMGGEGEYPVLYELGPDALRLVSLRPLSLAPPLGDGRPRTRWEVPLGSLEASDALRVDRQVLLASYRNNARRVSLIDLLQARSVWIAGADAPVRTLLAEFIDDLSAGRWSESPRLVAFGSLPVRSRSIERLRSIAQLSELGSGQQRFAREPAIVFVGNDVTDEDTETIARAMGRDREMALVVLGAGRHARVVLFAEQRFVTFDPTDGEPFDRPNAADADPLLRAGVGAPEEIRVELLGPARVVGAIGNLERRPKLVELIAYLAVHPQGALTRTWSDALWPDRRVPPQTIANRLSEARRALGVAVDGRPRLRRSGDRHWISDVRTDIDEFSRLAHDGEPSSWEQALMLVRGRPFEDLQHGQWAVLEGYTAFVLELVSNCALNLGDHALRAGNGELALRAARQGLLGDPYDERLHRLAMRAADLSGNRGALEMTLKHLALLLDVDESEVLHYVHPDTAELYALLSGSRSTNSAGAIA